MGRGGAFPQVSTCEPGVVKEIARGSYWAATQKSVGGQPMAASEFGIHIVEVDLVGKSLLGFVKDFETLENLRHNIEVVSYPEIDIFYVGGMSVLLSFENCQKAEAALVNGKSL